MGCSGLQTESQECETSERKCESFPVIDTSSVCPSLERKDKENCESVRGGGLKRNWGTYCRECPALLLSDDR